jgi:fumarate reductase subunit C
VSAPQTYRTKPSIFWWLRKRSYQLFALREISSVFVAWFVVVTTVFAWSAAGGSERYEGFLDVMSNPILVLLNVVALAFLLLHTVTWFNLTPKAMPVRLPRMIPSVGGRRVPSIAIVAGQWVGFAVVSALFVWLVVR